ncbi:MAG: hypothetical protein K0Q55_1744 [Verrucomicrobia bacterium]|jgi:hypothetical protein|nr:hypothetical protein [Verrucomicrobiota bacterium]
MPARWKEWLQDLGEDIRESCGERSWPGRLIFWLLLVHIAFQHARDKEHWGLLGGLNLGIHEFGHLICSPLGELIGILGGSLVQCLVPVISLFMFKRQRDYFAWSFSLVWLASNLHGVARYIADSRKLELELVSPFGGDGETIHDWNWLLNHWDVLQYEQEIAQVVRMVAILISIVGVGWGAFTLWLMFKGGGAKDDMRFQP